ncbi:hypothetical protein HOLleu_07324 [Holothuria leucospilota]|uniref:Uncharacterized protein n=1 Tax=Holothuria leucospilota TaxID=206669 RepID=A0A9Q1CH62_HOLLE|nr:hypothetical protein HOLleu_07324 [Holothuria leucospilota]
MRDYSRPTRGRGGRPYWRGRGDYHHQGSYHDRYSSSHRPSHSSRYDYDRSRDRRDRRDEHSHRDRRSYSNDRRGRSRSRSRSRSLRRRYSREKYSRSRSRSRSYSSRSRSSSRGRSSRSRSHSQSHHKSRRDSKESHTMKQVGLEPQSTQVSVTTGNASSSQNTVLEKQEHGGTSSSTLAGNRNSASIPTDMTTTIPAPAVVTIPPPSRWEKDNSPDVNFQSKMSKEYEESVTELYAGINEPSHEKDPKYGSSKLKQLDLAPMEKMSPVNLQKKSLVITFSNDRFQNSSAVAPKKAVSGEELAGNQSTFETAVTPPRVSGADDPPTLPATSGTAAQQSLFPAANRPMWKPVGEVDLPSPLITESQPQASGTSQKKVTGTTEGTSKKKSKEDLQKEIRELELALEKKRNAKKASSEEVQSGEKDTYKEGKRGRSRSKGSESSRSSSESSSESSRERESRRRNSGSRGDRGKKKYNDKEKYRKEHISEDRYNEREQSKYEGRDKEKLRRSREYDDSLERRSGKHRRERSERDEGQSEKRRKHGEGNDHSDTNEQEGALHASLLSASEENMETNKADKNDHESSIQPVLPFMTSQSIQPSSDVNLTNLSSRTTASNTVSQSDVLSVDHFLQSLGLPSSSTAASTSTQVSYSLPSTGQMSSYPDESNRSHPPGLSSSFSEEMNARDKASLRDQFGFPYQYQEGQSLPGLDLHETPSTLPPAPAPSGGFQNADEEDEYLYGSVSSEKNEPDQNKVEEYVPEEKPPPEKGEKDEQLNKILSAIGFDFDMAKQIVEQTKRKEEQIKEQSQKKGVRKGKKVEDVSDPPVTSESKQQKDDHKAEITEAKTNSERQESKKNEKDVSSIAAQPIPRLVRRTIVSDDASQSQNSNEWSNQYYGPTASSSYYSSTTNAAPVNTGTYGQVETQYGPPVPAVASTGGAPPAPPTHGPLAPPTHGPPVPPSHGPPVPPSHGPPVPPSHGPPVPPSHGPPVPSGLPPGVPVAPRGPNPSSQGPPVPPQGPPPGLPPQYGPGYDNYSQAPYPHQWQDSYGYDQMHQPDGGYYRRSPSPGYSSQDRYSRSLSQSPSRSRSFSRSRSPSPGRSFSSSPGRSPYASRPPKRKKKQKKYKSKMPESDGEHSEKYMKKKKKKSLGSGSRDRPKDGKKNHEGEKRVSKEGEESKERGSVSGIKVSLSRDQNEDSSRRVITMPKAKSRSRSPEKKSKRKGRTSTQEEKEEVQSKEKAKVQDAELLIKQQEKLLVERMEKKKREMEKELEKEKNKKEQELQNLDWEFQKREREIKKREEIIMRVEEKLRKEQDKRAAEEKKMEQEQQRKLKKEKEDYKRRLQFLQKELDRLKRNQGEMLRKKQKEKDGHKDPELMENNQQQEEILTQIKRLRHAYSEAYGKPLPEEPEADEERSRHSRESSSRERSSSKSKRSEDSRESRHSSERGRARESEKELSEGKSRFNFIYFDSCDHWCSCCNKTLRNINEYLMHLHSKNHMKKCDPHDRPWKALTQPKQQPSQPSSSSSSSIQAPFKAISDRFHLWCQLKAC